MGAFSHKFSIAPSGETTDRIKKVREGGARMGRTSSIIMVRIVGRAPATDEKVWCFYFCLPVCFFVTLCITKFVIMETLWSSVG